MLKTSSNKLAEPRKDGVRVGKDSRAGHTGSKIDDRRKIDGGEVDGNEVEDDKVEKKVKKTSKSKNLFKSKKTVGTDFLTLGVKLAFIELKQVFFKASILYHFNPKRYIWIEMNVLGYAINGVFNQLTPDDLGQ